MRAIAIAIVLLVAGTAVAQQAPPIKEAASKEPPSDEAAIRRELERLRAEQRQLERWLTSVAMRPTEDDSSPRFRFGHDGFAFGTRDGKSEVRLRLVLHLDGRAYLDGAIPDTFLVRRARPFIEGTLFGVIDFRLMPDFALGQAVLQDAYVELHPWRWLRLRAGRFMVPLGLEWLQSDSTIVFVERSLATDLVPFRDLGVMLTGDVGGGTFSYALCVLNGAPDGANGPDFDPQSDKDYLARIFLRPLRLTRIGGFSNLGFGVAASYGNVKATATSANLPSYRSTGQQTIFTYLDGAAVPGTAAQAAGPRWRVSPQAYWYLGPVGLMAEYVLSTQRVQRLDSVADLQNRAWNVAGSFVLTLERAAYEGIVPKHPVDFRHRGFGAVEIGIRYSELRTDPRAFPAFADPTTSVRMARELAGSVNWYPTDHVRIMLSFYRTYFVGGAVAGDRQTETALMGRLQLKL